MDGGCAEWTIPRLTDAWKWTESPTEKRGMVRAGRSASRTIDDSDGGGHHPAWRQPKDGTHRPRWTPHAQGFPPLGSLTPAEEKWHDHPVLDGVNRVVARNSTMESISHSERDGGRMAPLGRNKGVPRRGMRPAGVSGPAQQMAPVGVRNVKGRSAGRPLSVEAVEFSPTLDPEMKVMFGQKSVSSGVGGVAPEVVADVPVPTEAGVTFSAVAEVHASASVIEDDILVVPSQ